MYSGGKGKSAWEDDHYDDYDEDEEYEEYDEEDEDYALAKKREEDKKAAAKKAAQAAAKKAPARPKAAPDAKKAAPAEPEAPVDKAKIEEDNRKMNYQLSAELFGGLELTSIPRPDIKLPADQTFESFTPKTEAEFELLAQYVGGHIAVHSREFYYRKFIKSLLKHAFTHLQPSDIEDIGVGVSSLQAARESEIQAARSAAAQVKTRADDYGDFM